MTTQLAFGLCHCGCGQPTPLASKTDRRRGLVKGEPVRYIVGHQTRYHELPIRIEDRGYETPCHIWQAAIGSGGYAVRGDGKGGLVLVHRYLYEQAHGPVPDGFDVHHRCHERRCVRVDHLEPLTRREHQRHHAAVRRGEVAA